MARGTKLSHASNYLFNAKVTACLMEEMEQQWLHNACEAVNGKCFALIIKGKDRHAVYLEVSALLFGILLVMCNKGHCLLKKRF